MTDEFLELFKEINKAKYLYLDRIEEPEDNALLIILNEARAEEDTKFDQEISGKLATRVRSIETTPSCVQFHVYFDSYICYAVTNESFFTSSEAENYSGHLIGVYSKSHFLDFKSKTTFADDDFPGPHTHYGIYALNHCIDVISCELPNISVKPII